MSKQFADIFCNTAPMNSQEQSGMNHLFSLSHVSSAYQQVSVHPSNPGRTDI